MISYSNLYIYEISRAISDSKKFLRKTSSAAGMRGKPPSLSFPNLTMRR